MITLPPPLKKNCPSAEKQSQLIILKETKRPSPPLSHEHPFPHPIEETLHQFKKTNVIYLVIFDSNIKKNRFATKPTRKRTFLFCSEEEMCLSLTMTMKENRCSIVFSILHCPCRFLSFSVHCLIS